MAAERNKRSEWSSQRILFCKSFFWTRVMSGICIREMSLCVKRCCVETSADLLFGVVGDCKIELFLSWLCCVFVCNISCCSIVTLEQWHFWCGAQSKAPARINKGQKISNNSWLQQNILHSAVCWPLLPILQHFLGRISH